MPRESTPYEAAMEVSGAIASLTEEVEQVPLALDSMVTKLSEIADALAKPVGYEYCYADNPAEANRLGKMGWRAVFHIPSPEYGTGPYVWMERGIWTNGSD